MERKSFFIQKILCVVISSLCIILSFMIFNENVLAESTDNNSYDIQIFNDNQNFNMPKNTASYYIDIPKGTALNDDCYVYIHYAFSNTLISHLSNMALNVNGTYISTQWIYDIQKDSPNWWKVDIPISMLKVGAVNEIRIESNHRSIEGDCADIDNLSNWVTIYNDSKLHLSVNTFDKPLLGDFYSLYFENLQNKQKLAADFVLPKTKNYNLVAALLKISSSIGKMNSDRVVINYNVLNKGEPYKSNQNKILIGPVSEWKAFSNLILPSENLYKNQGFLSIEDQKKDMPYYQTLISGEDDLGVNKSVDFISNNTLLTQIKDKSLVVNSQAADKYNSFTQNKKGIYKFSDWGYSDINLPGAFHQKSSFSFIQPNGIQGGKGSYINLKFAHSKLLLSDRSLLTIYINGKIIDSVKLSNSNADSGNLKVSIPDSALKHTVIKVDVECYNYIGKIDCSKDYYDSAWTLINANSEICLIPSKVGIQPSLDNFPFFDTYSENKQPQVVMGLPENYDNNYLEIAATIATRAGQNSKESFNWSILQGNDNLTEKQKQDDMIFIGSFNNIKLPQKVKKSLPVLPLENNKFKIKKGLQVLPETLKNKILVQVIRSPWNFYKRIYIVSYDTSDNAKMLKAFLNNTNILWQMKNQVSVIDSTKEIHNMSVDDYENDKVPITVGSVLQIIEDRSGLPWWVFLIALIAIIVGVITVVRLRKKENQFQDTANKIRKEQGFGEDETEQKVEEQKISRVGRRKMKKKHRKIFKRRK
ncbi:cellulose biosynthesis cyclic di-GMP-binding regulatory protein BcsB [Clostridium sp. AWRP]|uniref:cellulose biosynthesis cyclic di-GMP-binding regulatory protein BcsB n=1 Tax=Clostridium sp. AWRP TaxID=2212991 RepID=UPI000FD7F910|nr:cellulose biosynthesis cyclic di-GMP-binding regulatory protein BcsB [Clostridium sp. AWRP]AZV55412.1 hypothetical protein DMR38_01650 [Clostridium sp. AWRP]